MKNITDLRNQSESTAQGVHTGFELFHEIKRHWAFYSGISIADFAIKTDYKNILNQTTTDTLLFIRGSYTNHLKYLQFPIGLSYYIKHRTFSYFYTSALSTGFLTSSKGFLLNKAGNDFTIISSGQPKMNLSILAAFQINYYINKTLGIYLGVEVQTSLTNTINKSFEVKQFPFGYGIGSGFKIHL